MEEAQFPRNPPAHRVRYKIALFNGGSLYPDLDIPAISGAEPSGSKLYGLTQTAITNFNPNTALVWLHNDLNTNNLTTGLQSGFHIVRARAFLARTNQASVYNTFLQTFYYDGALPTGTVAYPANGTTINSTTYTVVVRTDNTVTGVDFNIQDSSSINDDIVTGQPNGNGNGTNGSPIFASGMAVNPDTTLSAAYTNLPQEFRFVYTNVPISGTATIFVRLKEYGTSVYTNHYTLLAASVNTLAPAQVVQISSPPTNNTIINYTSNSFYLVEACFSSSLIFATNSFNVLINGVLQPQTAYLLLSQNATPACAGYDTLGYIWHNPLPGTNLIQVIYTNSTTPISDARTLTVAPHDLSFLVFRIIINRSFGRVCRGSVYEVLATTNLLTPFQNISGVMQSLSTSSYYYDTNPLPQKFYEIAHSRHEQTHLTCSLPNGTIQF